MSVHPTPSLNQSYTRGFKRFRRYYASSSERLEEAIQERQRQQGGGEPFYSGYGYYLSPSQHPVVMQQVNNAANQLVTETINRTPWTEMIPSWTEVSRMWVRSAQERWIAKRPSNQNQQERPKQRKTGARFARKLFRWA